MENLALVEQVFNLDKNIRFVTVIDKKGKLLESKHRKDITSILNSNESKKSVKQIKKFWKESNKFSAKYGSPLYSVFVYEKLKRIVIYPNKKGIFYVTADPGLKNDKVIPKIIDLISDL